jgi:uncharacterized protein YjdB
MFSSRTRKPENASRFQILKTRLQKVLKQQKGLTVVELLIAATILVIVLTSGYMFFGYGWRAFSTGTDLSIVNNNLRMTTERISNEIRYAGMLEIIDTADVPLNVDDDKIYIFPNATGRLEKRDIDGSDIIPHQVDDNVAFNVVFTKVNANTLSMAITETTSSSSMETEVRLLNLSNGNPIGGLSVGQALLFEMGDFGGSDGNTAIPVTNITVDPTSVTLTVGETVSITHLITPANATNQNVTFTPADQNVATVNSTGVITAVGSGSTTVTVTTEDGDASAQIDATVNSQVINVTGVSLSESSATLVVGESMTLTATIEPADATNKNISWSTSNASIAGVNAGLVSTVAPGTVEIIVNTLEGNHSDMCYINVIDNVLLLNSYLGDRNSLTLSFSQEVTVVSFNISGNQNSKMPVDPTPSTVEAFTISFNSSLNNNTLFTLTVQNVLNQTLTINLKVTGQSWSLQ